MERNFFSENQQLSEILKYFLSLPEFYFAKGNLAQKLVELCYYQLGNFQYPVHLLLDHWFKDIAESLNQDIALSVVIQNIRLKIIVSPVYKIESDCAIMSQDTYRVIGPIDEILIEGEKNIEEEIEQTILELENFEPYELGKILVSSPRWCKAKHLLEAVVYHFDAEDITNKEIVTRTIHKCFLRCSYTNSKREAT